LAIDKLFVVVSGVDLIDFELTPYPPKREIAVDCCVFFARCARLIGVCDTFFFALCVVGAGVDNAGALTDDLCNVEECFGLVCAAFAGADRLLLAVCLVGADFGTFFLRATARFFDLSDCGWRAMPSTWPLPRLLEAVLWVCVGVAGVACAVFVVCVDDFF